MSQLNFQPKTYTLPATAGNPQLSSYKTAQLNAQTQNSLVNSVGGKKQRRKQQYHKTKKGGTTNVVTVPTISTNGVQPLVPTVSPQTNVAKLTSLDLNTQNNAMYDNKVANINNPNTTKGGRYMKKTRKWRGGYLTKWNWECMSGGLRKQRKTNKKRRRTNKRRKLRN